MQKEKNLRDERRVLSVVVLCMILYIAFQAFSMLRLAGVPGISHMLLLGYRLLDLAMVSSFLVFIGGRVSFRIEDLIFLVFATYPLLIGIGRGNLGMSFFSDTAIYIGFLTKILVFRTLIIRVSKSTSLEAFFAKLTRRTINFSLFFAVAILFMAYLLLRSGATFYYQAPAEITFAAALVLGQGKFLLYFVFLVLALIAGKRMTMIGILFMGIIAMIYDPRIRAGALRFAPIVLILVPAFLLLFGYLSESNVIFLNKIFYTVRTVQSAWEVSSNMMDFLSLVEPGRYIEYVSLKPHLTGVSLWFGNGFGFRYELDIKFLLEFGLVVNDGDISNAHFTPLAIVAKFGLVGLFLWLVFLVRIASYSLNRSSYVHYAARLAFYSIIIQSLFAFGFFINFFTPIYIAIITMGHRASHKKMISCIVPQKK